MDLRIVELPFLYSTVFVPPGKRISQSSIVKGYAPFEVPFVTAAEAPLSTTWVHNDHYFRETKAEQRAEYYPDGPIVTRTRTFEGRTYLPASEAKGGVGIETVVADMKVGRRNRLLDGGRSWSESGFPIQPIVPHHSYDKEASHYRTEADLFESEVIWATRGNAVRKSFDDSEKRQAEASRSWREGLLVIDGEVWASRPDREPHYFLRAFPGDVTKPVVLDVTMGSGNSYWGVPFRADRRDDAVAFGKRLATRLGKEFENSLDFIDVPDPALLVRDQAVMLAGMIGDHSGTSSSNRDEHEPWSSEMEAAHERLASVRRVAKPERDVAWAAESLSAFGAFRKATTDAGLLDASEARDNLRHGSFSHDFWKEVEADLRPDVVTCLEEEEALVMGF